MSTDVSPRNRVPAGVHEGGQFAVQSRGETDVSLVDRQGRTVEPIDARSRDWFTVVDADGTRHARHVSEIAWPAELDHEDVEDLAEVIEDAVLDGVGWRSRRIARRLDESGAVAPYGSLDPRTLNVPDNRERLQALIDDTFDVDWTPRVCARALAAHCVVAPHRDEIAVAELVDGLPVCVPAGRSGVAATLGVVTSVRHQRDGQTVVRLAPLPEQDRDERPANFRSVVYLDPRGDVGVYRQRLHPKTDDVASRR